MASLRFECRILVYGCDLSQIYVPHTLNSWLLEHLSTLELNPIEKRRSYSLNR